MLPKPSEAIAENNNKNAIGNSDGADSFIGRKKIFSVFLRMDSNSYINDISLTRYDIRRCRMIYLQSKYDIRTRPADEIKDFGRVPRNLVIRCAHNNIRSIICRRHISSLAERYHIEDISPVPAGTDIIEKRQIAPLRFDKALETKRFSASCTRLSFLLGLRDCPVRSGFFVFEDEMKKIIKSNRVQDVVIVCEIGIRVRDTCIFVENMT